MKSQKFNKVLTLNKSTVSHLNPDQMNAVNGGYFTQVAASCFGSCLCITGYKYCWSDATWCC